MAELRDLLGLARVVKERLALCRELDDELVDVVLRPDVDAARDVEEEEHVGLGEQPAPDQHLLLIAARERPDRLQAGIPRSDLQPLDRLVDERQLAGAGGRLRRWLIRSSTASVRLSFTAHRQHQALGLPVLGDERDRKAAPDRVCRASEPARACRRSRSARATSLRAPKSERNSSGCPWPASPPTPRISPRRSSKRDAVEPVAVADPSRSKRDRGARRRAAGRSGYMRSIVRPVISVDRLALGRS